MSTDGSSGVETIEQRIKEFRNGIQTSFPSQRFEGKITPIDCDWTPDSDDERVLYETLVGKSWADVPSQFVRAYSGEISLLTNEAFAAFLPAWLECALDDLDTENAVRDYLVYSFSPRQDLVPDTTFMVETRVQSLNPQQQFIVRSLMDEFAKRDPSPFIRTYAAKAAALIDQFTNGSSYPPPGGDTSI